MTYFSALVALTLFLASVAPDVAAYGKSVSPYPQPSRDETTFGDQGLDLEEIDAGDAPDPNSAVRNNPLATISPFGDDDIDD